MPNDKTFAELLTAYLAGNADPGEQLQLIKLIKSGSYDDYLKGQIDQFLLGGTEEATLDSGRARELLSRILHSERHTNKLIQLPGVVKRTRYWVAAAIIVTGIGLFWWLPRKMANGRQLAKTDTKAPKRSPDSDGKKYIHLEDGSTVLLNKGSRLDYPASFKGGKREVTLKGEAYFEIHHDEKRPFIVHTGTVNTTVLGTAFNIRAYPGQEEITVTVTRGKVGVSGAGRNFGTAIRNESIAVNTGTNTCRQQKVNAEQIIGWKKDCLVLDNIRMEDAAILINSRYHVSISFSTEKLKNCHISATFLNNENLEQVLTVITGVVDGTYSIQPNDQVIISGEGCI